MSDDDLERSIASPDIVKPFASARAVTTERRFRKKFGFVPQEGRSERHLSRLRSYLHGGCGAPILPRSRPYLMCGRIAVNLLENSYFP